MRACVLDSRASWDKYLLLIEFAYNNSHHVSNGMAPYEALYGRKCQSPLCWFESGEQSLSGPDAAPVSILDRTSNKVMRKVSFP